MKSVSCKQKPRSTNMEEELSISWKRMPFENISEFSFCWKPKREIRSILLFWLLSLIGLHTWYQVLSLDCLKASDDQIAFLQSTTSTTTSEKNKNNKWTNKQAKKQTNKWLSTKATIAWTHLIFSDEQIIKSNRFHVLFWQTWLTNMFVYCKDIWQNTVDWNRQCSFFICSVSLYMLLALKPHWEQVYKGSPECFCFACFLSM